MADFLTAPRGIDDSKEEVVARAGGSIHLDPSIDPFAGTLRCSNCRGTKTRRPIHCLVGKDGQPRVRCTKTSVCECKCRTHYIGQDGRLRPYGVPDDSFSQSQPEVSPAANQRFEKILNSWPHKRRQK